LLADQQVEATTLVPSVLVAVVLEQLLAAQFI
jgi:hypothetical protein